MPIKDPVKRAAKYREWYQENKASQARRNEERRAENKRRVSEYKLDKGCGRCGYNRCAQALDPHHPDGKEGPERSVCKMAHRGMSWDKIKAELDRCEILCANCHREEHSGH